MSNIIDTNLDGIPANGQDKHKLSRSNSVPNIKAESGVDFYVSSNDPFTKNRELRKSEISVLAGNYLDAGKKINGGLVKIIAGIASAAMAVAAFIPFANVALGIALSLAGACLIVLGAYSAITRKQESCLRRIASR